MNLLVLLAGSSKAFQEAGYSFPKPLIEIDGKPLVQYVTEQLASLAAPSDQLIFMLRKDENVKYHIGAVIKLLAPQAKVLEVQGETAGAACTALLAVDHMDLDQPLVIVNGDQIIQADLSLVIHNFQNRVLDGGILVFQGVHPRWSFVKCGPDDLVIETAEKRPISNIATAGFYYFKTGSDFVEAAQKMILKDAAVDGLFYVCPAYNELILQDRKIGVYRIDKEQYLSLATPKGVESFENHLKTQAGNR